MSSPYDYPPSSPNPSAYSNNDYQQTPYYNHTPHTHTPFLPPSPYSLPGFPNLQHALPPVTPTTCYQVPFPTGSTRYDGPDSNYADDRLGPAWDTRKRRPSWNGAYGGHTLTPDVLQPPFGGSHHSRRHSFGNHSTYQQPPQYQYQLSPWSTPSAHPPPQFFLNSWLNGSFPRSDFFFDIAPTTFSPFRLAGPGQATTFSAQEMQELATHPPLTRMRIMCELIPQWPIDLELRPNSTQYSQYAQPASLAPITVGDVMVGIHQAMHCRITHADWARLGRREGRTVTKAYRRRCGGSEREMAQGVRRVDFLVGRTRVLGLVREGVEDGWDVMGLVLGDGQRGDEHGGSGHGMRRTRL